MLWTIRLGRIKEYSFYDFFKSTFTVFIVDLIEPVPEFLLLPFRGYLNLVNQISSSKLLNRNSEPLYLLSLRIVDSISINKSLFHILSIMKDNSICFIKFLP